MESEEEGARRFFKERRDRDEEEGQEGQEDQEEDQERQKEQEEQQEQQEQEAVVEELQSILPPTFSLPFGSWFQSVRLALSTTGAFAIYPRLSDALHRFDCKIRYDGAESPGEIGNLYVNLPVATTVAQYLGEHG